MPSGQEIRACRAADRVAVGPGKADAGFGQLVDAGCVEVICAVAVCVQRALVIGDHEYDVRLVHG